MTSLSNPELEAKLLADPNDTSAYLVYGDWLTERGDPRGELIAVQAKRAAAPDDAALQQAEAALLKEHGPVWLGALHGAKPSELAVEWRLGFLSSARIGPPLDDYATSDRDFPEMLEALLALPGIDLLRELTIGGKDYDDYPTSWQPELTLLAERGVPRGLRKLVLDCGGYWDISSTTLGELAPVYPRLGALEELRIRMGALDLGSSVDLPALRSLEIETGGLTKANVAAIRAASWPRLERLSLCIGETDNDYGCDVDLETLLPLLHGEELPRVRHLGLCNTNHADALAEELARSAILRQLESLDLSRGTFGDVGARAILDHAAAFSHLKTLDLTHHYVSAELQGELRKLGPEVVLDDAEQADVYDGEESRYVAISE